MTTTQALAEVLRRAPVVPVLIVDRLEDAAPLGRALVAGGLPALEVTLRTPVALDVIRAMAEIPGGVVGAGTILDIDAGQGGRRRRRQVPRQPGRDAGPARRRRRPRRAAASRCRHRQRGDDGARTRTAHPEVLPGRTGRRTQLSEVARLAAAGHPVLPDRRRHPRKRPRLSEAPERDLRRRLLGRPGDAVKSGDFARVEQLAREAAGLTA